MPPAVALSGSHVSWSELTSFYRRHYALVFRLAARCAGDSRFAEAYEWCVEQWGAPASRRTAPLGFFCASDSRWNVVADTFYFKDEESCVLFQLRWR